MRPRFRQLFLEMKQAVQAQPEDLIDALNALPTVGALPPPLWSWLFVVLLHLRKRQQAWTRLLQDRRPELVPLRRDAEPMEVTVPGRREWKVKLDPFVGFGTATHRTTGEAVPFSLDPRRPEVGLYEQELQSMKPSAPWTPEARLLELDAQDGLWNAIEGLMNLGYLRNVEIDGTPSEPGITGGPYRLTRRAIRHAWLIERFSRRWADPQWRLWLAAAIGDWPLAHELARKRRGKALIALTVKRAEECREQSSS